MEIYNPGWQFTFSPVNSLDKTENVHSDQDENVERGIKFILLLFSFFLGIISFHFYQLQCLERYYDNGIRKFYDWITFVSICKDSI